MEKNHILNRLERTMSWEKLAPTFHSGQERALSLWRSIRTSILLGTIFLLFLTLVQFSSPDLPDNDGYYHIKLAYLMRVEGLKPDFPWLPLSILNPREFYDHHFLFHVALMPFTYGDLRLGAKWAAVIFAGLAFLTAWMVFKNQRLPYAGVWALGLVAVSEAFIYRMSITRAQSLSLAVLMVGLDWLLRKKYSRLAPLAFVYVWLYNAFPLLLVIAFIYVLASWLIERRLDVRPLVYTSLGIALGLVINPYFPHNIVFAGLHILPKLVETTAVQVGNEWYPYDTGQLLKNSPLALVAFVSGALALGLSGKRIDLRTLFSLFLAGLFGLMLFQSRRFIEYFPAFALVFAAFAWTPVIQLHSPVVQKKTTAPGRLNASWLGRISVLVWLRDGVSKAVASAGASLGVDSGGVADVYGLPSQPAKLQAV
jgi:intracellular septation protein A